MGYLADEFLAGAVLFNTLLAQTVMTISKQDWVCHLMRVRRTSLIYSWQEKRWTTDIPADDDRLKGLIYVSLESIRSATSPRELICQDCAAVVFIQEGTEICSFENITGVIELPEGISVTIYKGWYSVN